MRTRKEIEEEQQGAVVPGLPWEFARAVNGRLTIETLLDIRELLSQEQSSTPVSEKEAFCKSCMSSGHSPCGAAGLKNGSVEARENQRNQELSQAKQDADDHINL